MCGRYRLSRADRISAALDAQFDEFSEIKIIHQFDQYIPSNRVPIVRMHNQLRIIDEAGWGFVPSWAKGGSKIKPINIRADNIATSKLFRSALLSSRCLMPADGFFEPKGPKTMRKRPQFFFQRNDGDVFAFAALWSQTGEGRTCALITTEPNSVVGAIHDRMPVILRREDYAKWLDPATQLAELQKLLVASPDDELTLESERLPPDKLEPTLFD